MRKTQVQGCKTGTFFEFPQCNENGPNLLATTGDFATRVLSKLQACVGVGIYSLKLTYSDGTLSPLLGSRGTNKFIEFPSDVQVKEVSTRTFGENYVQQVAFVDGQKTIGQFSAEKTNGKEQSFALEEHERIIGVYGYLDGNADIRGFGFIVAQ